jgi:uncharacterized membrane protein YdbT with pleckstrin-like domain
MARLFPRLVDSEAGNIITVRQHPAILLAPVMLVVSGLAVAIISTVTGVLQNWVSLEFIWVAWTVLLVRLSWITLEWSIQYIAIAASYEVVVYSGLVRRKVKAMSLTKVVRLTLYRSIPGRFFGYGELQFESLSQDQPFWSLYYVPYPEQLFLELYGVICPDHLYPGEFRRRRVSAEIEP